MDHSESLQSRLQRPDTSSEYALARAAWQPRLFGHPTRADLITLSPTWNVAGLRVAVHRNHGFETVASVLAPFAAWNRLHLDCSIGAYDDSLAFFGVFEDADIQVLWLDLERLTGLSDQDVAEWMVARLRDLRARCVAPILLLAWPLSATTRSTIESARIAGTFLADLDAVAVELGARWLDLRAVSLSGTRISNPAAIRIARELACRWIPACVLPPVKALALDLDETLYRGVLGEDGVDGIELTPAMARLQTRLVQYARDGVLLALVSRNELEDVEQLFSSRADFPLRWEHFSAVEVSWDEKSAAIARIAERLRIGADSIVFVDDNPGELAAAASRIPITTVHSGPDADQTLAAIENVAGLWRWKASAEDTLRADDLRAAAARSELARTAPQPEEYLRSLRIQLKFCVNAEEDIDRVAELALKTNQFNLSLRRSRQAEIGARMRDPSSAVVTIRLLDRLSDSGLIGAVIGTRCGETLMVEEVCISCRALGRQLEDTMLTQALLLMGRMGETRTVSFAVGKGLRNQPARAWCANYAGTDLTDETQQVNVPFTAIASKPLTPAVTIEVQA